MAYCNTCYRHCHLEEGMQGACRARICRDGAVTASGYGEITAISLDPIEKKPLARFCPGSKVLSVGFLGCNFNCPFCQNYDISYAGKDKDLEIIRKYLSYYKQAAKEGYERAARLLLIFIDQGYSFPFTGEEQNLWKSVAKFKK